MRRLILSILILLTLLAGCREITTNTTFFTDGSMERRITLTGDSASVREGAYFIPDGFVFRKVSIDSADGRDDKIRTASVHYESSDELNRALFVPPDSLKIGIEVVFKKRFRWFYTYYFYRETYRAYNQLHKISVTDYLTREELAFHLTKSDDRGSFRELFTPNLAVERNLAPMDTADIERRFDEWKKHALFEEVYQWFVENATQLNDAMLTGDRIAAVKETLLNEVMAAIDESQMGESPSRNVLPVFQRILGTSAVWKLEDSMNEMILDVNRKVEFMFAVSEDAYINEVVLPGLLVATNAREIDGNQLRWTVTDGHFFLEDYVMTAVSRTANEWTLYPTAGVVLLLVIGLIVGTIRHRNS